MQDVADFLRYHALRQLYPDLPLRPMLITGPSGCGRYGSLFLKKRNGIRNPIFRILLNKRKQASGK